MIEVLPHDGEPPGGVATITYTFEEVGAYDVACYLEEPVDHYVQGIVYPFVAVEEWVPRAVHETAAQARTCSWSAVLDACEPPGSHTKNYAH